MKFPNIYTMKITLLFRDRDRPVTVASPPHPVLSNAVSLAFLTVLKRQAFLQRP